jgi:hypothetical protein
MIERTVDQIEQRHRELRYRELKERLPQGLNEWFTIFNYRLLDNIPAEAAFLDRDFILRKQNRTYSDYLRLYSPVNPDKAIGNGKTSGILIFCLDVTRRFKAIEEATEFQNKLDQAKSTITTLLDLKEEVRVDLERRKLL